MHWAATNLCVCSPFAAAANLQLNLYPPGIYYTNSWYYRWVYLVNHATQSAAAESTAVFSMKNPCYVTYLDQPAPASC
jgi:hypothetical protein